MKRSYLLVYVLVIISFLFMIVLKITEDTVDKTRINTAYIDNIREKYDCESIAHYFLSQYSNEDINIIYDKLRNNLTSSNNIKIPIKSEFNDIEDAEICLAGEDIQIKLKNKRSLFAAEIILTPINMENDIEKVFNIKLSKKNMEDMLKENLESIDNTSLNCQVNNTYLLSPYASNMLDEDTNESTETDTEIINFSVDRDKSNIDYNKKKCEGIEKSLSSLDTETNQSDKNIATELPAKEKYIFGPKIVFNSDHTINTSGILYINENTIINAPEISHRGLMIVTGQPKMEKSIISLNGRLVNPENISIEWMKYNKDDKYILDLFNIDLEFQVKSFIIG